MGRLIDADKLLENQYRIDDSATLSTRDVVNVEDIEDTPIVEAISKADYEARLKADMVTILDKIRTEILEEKECAYADFEQYKVDYLGQDWEDVLDSLPHDDFRYGMERAIELIDKCKAETEAEDRDDKT